MVVLIPVAGLVVDLDITHPQGPSDIHLRIKEIRPGVPIVQARVYHLDAFTVGRFQFLQREQFMLPHIMQ